MRPWKQWKLTLGTLFVLASYSSAQELPPVTAPVPASVPAVVPAPAMLPGATTPVTGIPCAECNVPTVTESMPEDPMTYLFPQTERLKVYGWLNAGFMGNTGDPRSKFNGPYNGVDRANEIMFNQGYLVTEYGLPTDGSFGIGARVDVLYGEDFLLAQSAGLELYPSGNSRWNSEYYGLAIPQAYVQIGRQDLNVKVGHFYTPIGYEGVPATANFFYSKSYSYQFFGPFTHWGALGSWNATDNLQLFAGLTNGWNALDRENDKLGVLAGFKYTADCKRWWTSFAITSGDENSNVANLPSISTESANRTRYSYIFDINLTDRLEYVFHHHLGTQMEGAPGGGTALWYGLDQYLYYTLNDAWKVGTRVEWIRDNDGTRIGLNRPSNPNNPPFVGDVFSLTLGANWMPMPNLTIRPEIRGDWYNGSGQPYNDGSEDYQFMIGLDAILRF